MDNIDDDCSPPRTPVEQMKSPSDLYLVSPMAETREKIREITNLLFLPDDDGKYDYSEEDVGAEERRAKISRAMELYQSLNPADGSEGMLAVQMVGTHSAAVECLHRAAEVNQTPEAINMALNQAHKLMALYTKQLSALDKHRGKGQQKVTVEHVNVAPGGQAIVGNVETSRKIELDGK